MYTLNVYTSKYVDYIVTTNLWEWQVDIVEI